jgi:hypothetical protein
MKKKNPEILHHQFSVTQEGRTQTINNYMVLVFINEYNVPEASAIVDMHDFYFYHEDMPYYVINQN